jgi:hypothetical protein
MAAKPSASSCPKPRDGIYRCIAIEFPLLRFVRVFSKFVVRNWYSDDATKFQPVDEIIIPLSIQMLALMLHFFYSIKCRQA